MGETIAFLGLGIMGCPIALNLVKAGHCLSVWNRSEPATEALAAAGAQVAATPKAAVEGASTIFIMLRNIEAIDIVLSRADPSAFAEIVAGRTIVNLGTIDASRSLDLSGAVTEAGGSFVEAPVSGSKVPAESGTLVGMVAGPKAALDEVEPYLAAFCASTERCGQVPAAIQMKLAVNTYLAGLMSGLIEGFAFAHHANLDVTQFARILEAGPMSNVLMSMKLPKMVARDYDDVQGAVGDAIQNSEMIMRGAENIGATVTVTDGLLAAARQAAARGLEDKDFSAALEIYLKDA